MRQHRGDRSAHSRRWVTSPGLPMPRSQEPWRRSTGHDAGSERGCASGSTAGGAVSQGRRQEAWRCCRWCCCNRCHLRLYRSRLWSCRSPHCPPRSSLRRLRCRPPTPDSATRRPRSRPSRCSARAQGGTAKRHPTAQHTRGRIQTRASAARRHTDRRPEGACALPRLSSARDASSGHRARPRTAPTRPAREGAQQQRGRTVCVCVVVVGGLVGGRRDTPEVRARTSSSLGDASDHMLSPSRQALRSGPLEEAGSM